MTDEQIKQTFIDMKTGTNILSVLPDESPETYYYFMKSYKLVDDPSFFSYCAIHKEQSSITPFHQMLLDVLSNFYPPLEYNHPLEKGMDALPRYYNIALEVFTK